MRRNRELVARSRFLSCLIAIPTGCAPACRLATVDIAIELAFRDSSQQQAWFKMEGALWPP